MNKWKIATIILALVFLGLIILSLYNPNQNININGFKMDKNNFNNIVKFAGERNWTGITICSLESMEESIECTKLYSIG